MSILETLKEESRKLAGLMADPHPGLATWNEFAIECCKNLARLLPTSTLQDLLEERLKSEAGG
jgi:hypothetical protein